MSLTLTSVTPAFTLNAHALGGEAPDGVTLAAEVEPLEAERYLVHITARVAQGELGTLSLSWEVPATDAHGLYFGGYPGDELSYLPFHRLEKTVRAHTGVPYTALVHRNGANRFSLGLLEQRVDVTLHAQLSELTRCYHFRLERPGTSERNGQTLGGKEWRETLYVSTRSAPWFEELQAYVRWVDRKQPSPALPVPEHAFDPVFCTWTAVHHDVSHDWTMRTLPLAADLGFKTFIMDDGWFLEGGLFGDYRHVGSWQPETSKFPDFAEHVRAVKDLGFRYLLWVAPFMIGYDNPRAEQEAHLLTTGQRPERFHNLSPWHPDTARVVRELLLGLLERYDLDGFKLDFIDALKPWAERGPDALPATMGERMAAILSEAVDELVKRKPGLLTEFRNTYTNLASRRYANLYRSSDVPINPGLNRWQATLLRLLAPDRAVHTDPALWHPDDSDENVAVHLINLIAAVPMVSVELDRYPASHLALIRHWLGFYEAHRRTLVHGEFAPTFQAGRVPLTRFSSAQEHIIGVYDDVPIELPLAPPGDERPVWLLNASSRNHLILRDVVSARVTRFSRVGEALGEQAEHTHRLDADVGGFLKLERPQRLYESE